MVEDRCDRVVDAHHVPDLAAPHACRVDDVLSQDRALLGFEFPAGTRALDSKDPVVGDDGCAALASSPRIGVDGAVGIEVAFVRVEEAASEPVGIDDRYEVDDLVNVEKPGTLVPHHFVPGDLGLEPAHALGSARELDAARELESDVDAALLSNLRVHGDRVALKGSDDGVIVDGMEPPGCMPT